MLDHSKHRRLASDINQYLKLSTINRGLNLFVVADPIIDRGMQLAAAAATLGYTPDEMVAIKLQQQRQEQFEAFMRRQSGDGFEEAEAALADMPADIDEFRTIPNSQVEFGEQGNQDQLQNFLNQDERDKAGFKRDPNEFRKFERVKGKDGRVVVREKQIILGENERLLDEQLREQAILRDFGLRVDRDDIPRGPRNQQQGWIRRDAKIQRLVGPLREGERRPGVKAEGGRRLFRARDGQEVRNPRVLDERVVPFNAAVAPQQRVPKEVDEANNQVRIARERRVARDLIDRDRLNQNAEMVEANNWRAQAAQNKLIQERAAGSSGAHAAQAFQNMGRIAEIGHWKDGSAFKINNPIFNLGRANAPVLPVNLPELYNAPTTDNRFAGPLQKQEQFIVDHMPGFREGGAFGDFAQVGINEQIEAARGALGDAKFKGQAVDFADARIRNLGDLQRAANAVIALGQAKGQNFFKREDGKNVPVANPGINEVLQRGGMNARQVGDVAKAMFALEAAKKNPLNEEAKRAFFLGKPNPVARSARGAVFPPNHPLGGKEAADAIAFGGDHPALGGGDAKIAMLRGEKVGGKEVRAQLQALDGNVGNPGEALNVRELGQARMPFIGGVAGEGIPRAQFVRGEDRMLNDQALIAKHGPVNGQIAINLINRREQQAGVGADGFGLRRPNVTTVPYGRQDLDGARNVELPSNVGSRSERESAVLSSAGGGGGGDRPPTATAAPSPGGEQPKWKRMGYMTAPDGASRSNRKNREVIKRAERGRTRRGAGLAAGGTLAGMVGLDALIGGERDRREEEVYA